MALPPALLKEYNDSVKNTEALRKLHNVAPGKQYIEQYNESLAKTNALRKLRDEAKSNGKSARYLESLGRQNNFRTYYDMYLNSQLGSGVTPSSADADIRGGILNQIPSDPAAIDFTELIPDTADADFTLPGAFNTLADPVVNLPKKPRFDYQEGDFFNTNKAPKFIQDLVGIYNAYTEPGNTPGSSENTQPEAINPESFSSGSNSGVIPRFQESVFGPAVTPEPKVTGFGPKAVDSTPLADGGPVIDDTPAGVINTPGGVWQNTPINTPGNNPNYMQQLLAADNKRSIPKTAVVPTAAAAPSFLSQFRNAIAANGRAVANDRISDRKQFRNNY